MQKDYTLTIIPTSNYLHVVVTGKNTLENVSLYLKQLLEECRSRNCDKVLVEERLDGPRLSIADIFEIVSRGSVEAVGVINAIAYVDVHAVDDTMKFAETVANNRSVPVRVFPTIAEAGKWLGGQ